MDKPRAITTLAARTGAASPEHKRFQTLLGKIDKARARLAAWQSGLTAYGQAHLAQVLPLQRALAQERLKWALQLEQLQLAHKWSKADRATLSELICDVCGDLLSAEEAPDPAIKALYNRHAETDFDSELQEREALLQAMQQAFAEAGAADVDDAEDPAFAPEPPRKPARKAARQTAAQKRAEADERRISQTVREVFRKLASALHPDRLPADTPEAQRQQVNERMQRANAAYEAGDLLTLLELQLQIEQVDLAQAHRMAAEQVRHFNQVLAGQLRELEAAIDERQHAFGASYGWWFGERLNPALLGDVLKQRLHDLRADQQLLQAQQRLVGADPARLKPLLKHWRQQQRRGD
jgi:hypothetical protein